MGYEGSHSILWLCLYLILQRASSSQAPNLTMPDFIEVLSKGQMWVDERMENRRIINKILPCTLCPCKMGSGFQVWLQSPVALWRRALYAPILYLGIIFSRFGSSSVICLLLMLQISFSSCSAQATGSKILAQLPSVLIFCQGFFYLLWQAVSTPFLFLTSYTLSVFLRIPCDTHPPFKGNRTGNPRRNTKENTHQWSIRSFKSLNNYPESFLDNLFDVWLNDSMQSYCWSATIINQTDTTT